MSAVLASLCEWVIERPYWEQLALEKIIAGSVFAKEDYEDLIQLALEDKQLADRESPRPSLKIRQPPSAMPSNGAAKLRLASISNLQNVNALAAGQTLPISKDLTVIYGANGSGKSGYARMLGCGGFTRGDQEVLYDINNPASVGQPQTAELWFKDESGDRFVTYEIGKECAELKTFYVFDSTSVSVHLTKTNKVSFTPAGLSYLTRLGEVIDKCNDLLRQRTTSLLQAHNFNVLFQEKSETSRQILDLIEKGKETELKKLATFSEAERAKAQELDREIARLKSQDRSVQIADARQKIEDLKKLTQALKIIEQSLSFAVLEKVNQLVGKITEQQSMAANLSEDQFATSLFSQIGSPSWRNFIEAAFTLAAAEERGSGVYPSEGDHCLLCRQSLSEDARSLLHKLRAFLRDQSQSQLKSLRADLEGLRKNLISINLDCFDEQHVSFRLINQENQPLADKVKSFLSVAKNRRDIAIQSIQTLTSNQPPELSESGIDELGTLIQSLESKIVAFENETYTAQISDLERQQAHFRQREILHSNFEAISKWINGKKWAEKAIKALGTTAHISRKYDEIFDGLVTGKYIEVFQEVLKSLHCRFRVNVKTRTQKMEKYKTILLEAEQPHEQSSSKTEKAEKVLSEGEKRAVAMADFLTEVALDENSCGLILDDPVTSLDWEWEEVVAKRLAIEAKSRQVIIFTHDLHFHYLIKKYAKANQIELSSHLICRDDIDGRPGVIRENASPATEGDHRSPEHAMGAWHRAKNAASSDERQNHLHAGFGYLRRSYEALVCYDILGRVVTRFESQVSVGRLKEVVTDRDIFVQVMEKYEFLSGNIGSHLPHAGNLSYNLTLDKLKQEIEDYKLIKKQVSDLKPKS